MGRPKSAKFSVMSEAQLFDYCRQLYLQGGAEALSFAALKNHDGLYTTLYQRGITQKELLNQLGVQDEYNRHKASTPLRRAGRNLKRWSWKAVVDEATAVKAALGVLPPAGWFRANGHLSLVQYVYSLGRTWDDLRRELGDPGPSTFVQSRNGMRWRSHPEASLSNFLYVRGVPHRRGDRYPREYSIQSGYTHGYYDLHFKAANKWMDVEIWGDNPRGHGASLYHKKRIQKEKFNAKNSQFIGIHFEDCFSEQRLTEILKPYLGVITPFLFDRPTDRVIQSTHWSNTDELLDYCRHLAAQMPDGTFPTEEWLRKRGKWATRPGPAYNTLSVYIKQWFGGVRKLRSLLGQAHASTTRWDRDAVIVAWTAFWKKHHLTPNQVRAHSQRGYAKFSAEVVREAGRLVSAAVKYGGGASAINSSLGIKVARTRVSRR